MEFIDIIIYTSIYIGLIATTFYVLSFLSGKKTEKQLFNDDELPYVSVLIPAYNEEKDVERTIKSILNIDYPRDKFEVIFINDGSSDNTLKIAKRFESDIFKVFSKENGGKGTALNFGLKQAKGEIIFSMDADSFVDSDTMKKMVKLFKNEEIMCVSPAIVVHNPKTILQRIQYVEYLFGLFLRKAFSSVNAVHITPGAFSSYRKSFFDKYGGYDEGNLTEDLELALRIQYNGFIIGYVPNAIAYTNAPKNFFTLLTQRKRWYGGLIRNTWKYKGILFNRKYGDLGMFVFPIAWISIFFSVFVTIYLFFDVLLRVKNELLFLNSISFDFPNMVSLNFYFIERAFFSFFTNPIVIFLLFFLVTMGFFMHYASKNVKNLNGLGIGIPIYFTFFALLFGFWWIVSIIFVIFNRKIKWR